VVQAEPPVVAQVVAGFRGAVLAHRGAIGRVAPEARCLGIGGVGPWARVASDHGPSVMAQGGELAMSAWQACRAGGYLGDDLARRKIGSRADPDLCAGRAARGG